MIVKCLAQEHNTISPDRAWNWATRSGVKRTNHEANAPPTDDWTRAKYLPAPLAVLLDFLRYSMYIYTSTSASYFCLECTIIWFLMVHKRMQMSLMRCFVLWGVWGHHFLFGFLHTCNVSADNNADWFIRWIALSSLWTTGAAGVYVLHQKYLSVVLTHKVHRKLRYLFFGILPQ